MKAKEVEALDESVAALVERMTPPDGGGARRRPGRAAGSACCAASSSTAPLRKSLPAPSSIPGSSRRRTRARSGGGRVPLARSGDGRRRGRARPHGDRGGPRPERQRPCGSRPRASRLGCSSTSSTTSTASSPSTGRHRAPARGPRPSSARSPSSAQSASDAYSGCGDGALRSGHPSKGWGLGATTSSS